MPQPRVLEALEEHDPLQPALRCFELELLQRWAMALIFGPRPAAAGTRRYFEAQTGFRPAVAETTAGARLFSGVELQQIASRDFATPGTQDAAKVLMRAALAPLLGDKPLTSRKMFRR